MSEQQIKKIIITDNIMADSQSGKMTLNDALLKTYESEIKDRVSKDPSLANLSPIQMSMLDFGITKKSIVRDFNTSGAGEWLLPSFIETRLRESMLNNDLLSYVIGTEVGVPLPTVMSATLDFEDEKNKDAIKMMRVTEGADIPLAKIKLGQNVVSFYKRGRAVEITYEAMEFLRVDLFAKTLDSLTKNIADQQLGDAIDVLVNGDGNNNKIETAATTATANILVVDDLTNAMIAFRRKAKLPINTILAGEVFFKQLYKMNFNSNQVPGAESRFMLNTPQFPMQNVNVILDDRVGKTSTNKERIIILNKDESLIKYTVDGMNRNETDKNIRNQTLLGTITEQAGFGKFDKNASMEIVSA